MPNKKIKELHFFNFIGSCLLQTDNLRLVTYSPGQYILTWGIGQDSEWLSEWGIGQALGQARED